MFISKKELKELEDRIACLESKASATVDYQRILKEMIYNLENRVQSLSERSDRVLNYLNVQETTYPKTIKLEKIA